MKKSVSGYIDTRYGVSYLCCLSSSLCYSGRRDLDWGLSSFVCSVFKLFVRLECYYYLSTFELATLLMFLNVNLRLIFSTLPLLPSHVSSPRLRLTFYTVSQKKQGTTILSITSPNVDRFSIFFTHSFTSKCATKSSLRVSLNYLVKHPYRKIAKI